jgi:hypothetical protein
VFHLFGRLLGLCALAALALIWVDARWQADTRVLTLRLRSAVEIRALALERARSMGREWVQAWTEPGVAIRGSSELGVAAAPLAEFVENPSADLSSSAQEQAKP